MSTKEYFVPSEEVMTSIVLPTIVFCIGMVVAMLVGINKYATNPTGGATDNRTIEREEF
ncbi:unnamed protein product [Strongylus vulgaris]|uniref:Uncharacterized protein n=1 Tax=Strongylus vulgaris TaxID=40348 RepID=A0A3P7JBH3_STRVU|nr:unnamed protein product [Strongylus vulgaris]